MGPSVELDVYEASMDRHYDREAQRAEVDQQDVEAERAAHTQASHRSDNQITERQITFRPPRGAEERENPEQKRRRIALQTPRPPLAVCEARPMINGISEGNSLQYYRTLIHREGAGQAFSIEGEEHSVPSAPQLAQSLRSTRQHHQALYLGDGDRSDERSTPELGPPEDGE